MLMKMDTPDRIVTFNLLRPWRHLSADVRMHKSNRTVRTCNINVLAAREVSQITVDLGNVAKHDAVQTESPIRIAIL